MKSNQVFFYGLVSDNQDPDKLGRVKVTIESAGTANITPWIPVLTLQAGSESGFFFLPDVNDQVLVGFMDQLHQHGVVMGGVWSSSAKPPKTEENTESDLNADGKNNLKFYRSRSGLRLIFDDSDGKEKLQLISPDSETRFEFNHDEKKVIMDTVLEISICAKKKLSISAQTLSIKAKGEARLAGEGISIESKKGLELKASADIEVKGSVIKLN